MKKKPTQTVRELLWRGAAVGGLLVLGVALPTNGHAQLAVAAPGSVDAPAGVGGVWIDNTGRGAIEIAPCGPKFCGYVYWVKDPLNKQGKPVLDSQNPETPRRNKPMCGTRILHNLTQVAAVGGARTWGGGSIYNPEEGQTYDAELQLISPNKLSVRGFVGVKLFGETFIWTRAPADLARCGPARV